jgi:hypothetical protein
LAILPVLMEYSFPLIVVVNVFSINFSSNK